MLVGYDVSYCFRGVSGIPADSRSLARILNSLPLSLSLLLYPKNKSRGFGPKGNFRLPKDLVHLRNAMVMDSQLESSRRTLLLNAIGTLLSSRNIKFTKLDSQFSDLIVSSLGLEKDNIQKVLMADKSNWQKYIAARTHRTLKVRNHGLDVFIQQHVDPVKIENVPHVVRIHDLIPVTHPHLFNEQALRLFYLGLSSLLKNKMVKFVTDSSFTVDQFEKLFGKKQQIAQIPCAINVPKFENVDFTYSSKRNLVLVVGTIEPRKNIDLILDNWIRLKRTPQFRTWELYFVGRQGWMSNLTLTRLKDSRAHDVRVFSSCSDSDVVDFYTQAKILISASEVEGFGLTPLEGLAYGAVPVVSRIAAHKEHLGSYGFYFNKDSTTEFNSAMFIAREHFENSGVSSGLSEGYRYIEKNFSEASISPLWENYLNTL